MAVDATGSATSTTGVTGGRARLVESTDMFMKLLTAQIKNQDPLSPMDSTQFTQQLVQMTGVEQQLLGNELLQKLITNTGSGIQTSVSLLGREVRATSDEAKLVAGKADWNYSLSGDASDVKIEVLDSSGAVVKTLAGTDNNAGDHTFSWDGKSTSGAQMLNGGNYKLRVTAKDSAGADVSTTTYLKGLVTGVEQTDGKTLLTVNGVQVGWEYVTSIKLPEQTADTTTPDTDDEVSPSQLAA